jgi:molybdopterin biosynthesis enzyme
MSVDPDDVTPSAIKETGAALVTYGSPILPGAMFLLAYYGELPIMGIPGCAMYNEITVFDIILPRILIDEKLTKLDIAKYGHGGLCMNCDICTYPACNFGKI